MFFAVSSILWSPLSAWHCFLATSSPTTVCKHVNSCIIFCAQKTLSYHISVSGFRWFIVVLMILPQTPFQVMFACVEVVFKSNAQFDRDCNTPSRKFLLIPVLMTHVNTGYCHCGRKRGGGERKGGRGGEKGRRKEWTHAHTRAQIYLSFIKDQSQGSIGVSGMEFSSPEHSHPLPQPRSSSLHL